MPGVPPRHVSARSNTPRRPDRALHAVTESHHTGPLPKCSRRHGRILPLRGTSCQATSETGPVTGAARVRLLDRLTGRGARSVSRRRRRCRGRRSLVCRGELLRHGVGTADLLSLVHSFTRSLVAPPACAGLLSTVGASRAGSMSLGRACRALATCWCARTTVASTATSSLCLRSGRARPQRIQDRFPRVVP
jgi:hypothetical protein